MMLAWLVTCARKRLIESTSLLANCVPSRHPLGAPTYIFLPSLQCCEVGFILCIMHIKKRIQRCTSQKRVCDGSQVNLSGDLGSGSPSMLDRKLYFYFISIANIQVSIFGKGVKYYGSLEVLSVRFKFWNQQNFPRMQAPWKQDPLWLLFTQELPDT